MLLSWSVLLFQDNLTMRKRVPGLLPKTDFSRRDFCGTKSHLCYDTSNSWV